MMDLLIWLVNKGVNEGLEYVEARYQKFHSTDIEVRDGKVISAVPGIEQGVAIRVLFKGGWGFSTTNSISKDSLQSALTTAIKMAKQSSIDTEPVKLAPSTITMDKVKVYVKEPLEEVSIEEKIKFLLNVDNVAREISPNIKTTSNYNDYSEYKIICTSDGTQLEINNSWVYWGMWAYAREAGLIQSYRDRFAMLGGFEVTEKMNAEERSREAAKKAMELLKAKPAPGGKFTVVIDGVLSGLLAHEAIGHASEADGVLRGTSILRGKLGEKIGSEHVTLIDDATINGRFGTDVYDDEGIRAQRKVIIQKGILKGYLTNREAAGKMGLPLTGNARAQDYRFQPIVRMTNTFFQPGDMNFEELIEDIKYGIYAKGGRGGQVSPAEGIFQFGAQEAYIIKNGEITDRLRDFSMSGFILETLKNVTGVAKDFDIYPSFCGKMGQSMRNTCGGPHMRIENMMVGGRM
ncbi:MAG: TldD/PmbA family protein [Candidatus Methanomethylicia archaeon]